MDTRQALPFIISAFTLQKNHKADVRKEQRGSRTAGEETWIFYDMIYPLTFVVRLCVSGS